jgi:phosphoserine phosphatase
MSTKTYNKNLPILFVDLDESLIRTDILREQLTRSFATSPWQTLKMLFQEGFKPERVKNRVADKIEIDPATLPYNQDVLALIHQAKKQGRLIVLATATHKIVAKKIAEYLGVFDDVLATTPSHNCKGANKLAAMKDFSQGTPFDYVGDSRADLKIFSHTQTAYIVGNLPYKGTHQRFQKPNKLKAFIKALRCHQWAKNTLIFLPLLTSHHLSQSYIVTAILGFITFSLAASGIYIINGMVDVEDDRHHPSKKNRPFAKGDMTIDEGIQSSFFLLLGSLLTTWYIIPEGLWVLGTYILLTFIYSFSLKTKPIADVFCLTTLYTLRVFYGQTINQIETSSWLLAFCIFFFLSLAILKRTTKMFRSL